MLAASSGSKAFRAPPRRDVRPQRRSRRVQPARASNRTDGGNIYKPRVPFVDLYEVLALEPSATDGEVKTAYRILQKAVHPDLAGEYASAAAALVNEAASVLTSPADRARFDKDRHEWLSNGKNSGGDQSLMDPTPLSAWSGPARGDPEDERGRHDAAFVDESSCIGCLQCALIAPQSFYIETRFGCARVVDQWADGREAVEDAVAACPVQCIHFVNAHAELPLLERVAARQWREGGTGGGARARRGSGSASPFAVAASLRKKAARGGFTAWPSRRGRVKNVDCSAVDAAVAAAAAAAAAAYEASAWAEATGGEAEAAAAEAEEESVESNIVAVASFIDREVPTGSMFGGNAASAAYSTGARGPSSRIGGSSEEVARVQSLLDRGSGDFDVNLEEGLDAPAEFWEPPPDSERPASASFEEDDDGGYAPTEWLQSMRRNVRGSQPSGVDAAGGAAFEDGKFEQDGKFEDGQFDERTRSSRRRRPRESFAGVSRPLATASAAVAIAVGARLLFGAPQDAVAGVDPTIVVNGVRADWLNGEWASLGCSVVAWNVALTAAMLVADSVAFVAVGGDDEGDD